MRCSVLQAIFCILLIGTGLLAQGSQSQNEATPPRQQQGVRPQFFAGLITDVTDQKIVVSRTLLGRPQEKRTFLINSDTKLDKPALKPKLRVTVRYQHGPDGDVALEIQVQAPRPSSRPS